MVALMKRAPAFIVRQGSAQVVVYKSSTRNSFCLCYRKHAGAARSRETRTGEKAARARALDIAIALANGRAEVLELTAADRDSYLHAKSLLPDGVLLHEAIEQWLSLRETSRAHRPIPDSKNILFRMLLDLEDHQRSERHRAGLKRDLAGFVAEFPKLEAATEEEIANYIRKVSSNAGPRRRDNIRDSIVQLFRFARRRGYLPEDKRSEAEKIGKIKPGHDVHTWTVHQAAMLLEHISPRWLPWLALGLFAGLRTSEILRLDWSAVKFEQRVIAVSWRVARKVRTSRIVPILGNLAEWIFPFREDSGPIYPGKFKTTENEKGAEMNRLRKLLDLPRRDNANRHSFGSYRLAVVKNFGQVAVEMGNSPRKVREDYNDPKPEAEGIAYFALMPPAAEKTNIVPIAL
jgi:integrase